MEENNKDFKKWLTLIVITLIGYWIVNNLNVVGNIFSSLFNIIFPFILGGSIAFILNIPMTFFEKKLTRTKNPKKNNKKKETGKGLRVLSIIFAIIVILFVLTLIIRLIVPELIEVVNLLIDNIPYYVEEIIKLTEEYSVNVSSFSNMIEQSNIDIEKITDQIVKTIPTLLTSSISIVSSIISGVSTLFIAIIFAIYILIDKEKLEEQAKKMLYAYLRNEKAEKIIDIGRVCKNTFKNFFTVQCLEATILGTLCIIGMLILKIPYAVPIGVLVGVTALIPVVGAFIGIIIGAILIVSVEPFKVVVFVIFALILQQVEGNLIYPRVVGSSVGLPGMWVLFAVTVGGSFGGVIGMLLGVPVATVIYTLLKRDINQKTSDLKV